jgi:hypothetical protein
MAKDPKDKDEILVTSRQPHKLRNGRGTFLGFRSVKGFKENPDSVLMRQNTDGALMPDGGLSPCVIRVLGVGGGGCNAVRTILESSRCVARFYRTVV